MMDDLLSHGKGTFNVHLSGGSPWGFTLHGGSEFNSKLYIKRITPGGKASKSRALQVGDEVLCVNDIECSTRAKAIEHVKDSGQTLQLTIKRTSNDSSGDITSARQNGIKDKSMDSPSKYHPSGLDEVKQNDFYSTYSVDPVVYAKIVEKTKDKNNKMANSYDSELSASNEDLLNSYRKRGVAGSEEELDNIEKPSFSNGRISPNKELSGHSVPESQLHGRTFTSPGRIQKVKITSTNISSSSSTFSSPDDEGSRQHRRISPVKHSPIARQFNTNETEATADRDNWFERWLRDDKSRATADKDISVKDACSKFEEEEGKQDAPKSPTSNKSNFSRSKSFSGRPSYGVVFGTTAVKSDDQHSEITAYQAPLPSTTRYNSADLLRDKARKNIPAESWKHVEVETSPRKVTTIQEERNVQRMNRKSLGAFPMVSSTSSLDSFGDTRRQGPAIPPRRSESKLLRSMRRGKSSQSSTSVTTREASLREDSKPKHSVSNSWPSDYLGNTAPLVNNRQSWPPEEKWADSDASSRRGTGAKRSTSVVIKSVRTSSTSSDGNTKPKIYRSSSVEIKPENTTTEVTRPQSAQTRTRPTTEEKTRHQHQQQPQQQQQQQQHDLASHQQTSQQHQRLQQHHKPQQHPQPQYIQKAQQEPPQQQQQRQAPPPSPQQQQQIKSYQRPQQEIRKQQYTQRQQDHQQKEKQQQQQKQRQSFQQEADSLSSRIEDTQILQKLMKDSQVVSPPQSVRSRIQKIEKSSSQPNLLEEGPNDFQLKPGAQHHKQRSWDNSYGAFNRTFSSARSELRSTGRFGSTERLLDSIEHDEPENNKIVEKPISPVKVTSREITATTRTVVQSPSTQGEKPQKSYNSLENPINEQVLRTESSSTQEKEVYLEEMFKTLEEKPAKNTKQVPNRNLAIQTQSERNTKLSVGDDDVFTNTTLDDSLPPPPPPSYSYHETSYENLPLPTPPREIFVGEPFRAAFKRDKNRNEVYNAEAKSNERLSFTENKLKTEDSDMVIHNVDKNEGQKGLEDRQLSSEESMNVKNSKYEERFNERKTDSMGDNYINTEYKPMPSPKEKTFNESTSPSKSELDSTETIITKQSPSPIVMSSTPTRSDFNGDERASPDSDRGGNTSPLSGSSLSTPSSSRPGSMMSPKLEQLDKEKCELVDSMKNKIQDLRTQMNEITEEINENEKLGEKVTVLVEGKATPSEFSKYQRFTGELNKIVLLLLSLTQRMHRYENTLQELDMSEEADRQQRDILLDKIDHVKSQYEEACKIKEVNDKRGEVVSGFLENYLDEDEFADFQYYIDMKTQLALMHAEIKDKVKMGEERLNTLSATAIDWNVSSFCGY